MHAHKRKKFKHFLFTHALRKRQSASFLCSLQKFLLIINQSRPETPGKVLAGCLTQKHFSCNIKTPLSQCFMAYLRASSWHWHQLCTFKIQIKWSLHANIDSALFLGYEWYIEARSYRHYTVAFFCLNPFFCVASGRKLWPDMKWLTWSDSKFDKQILWGQVVFPPLRCTHVYNLCASIRSQCWMQPPPGYSQNPCKANKTGQQ